MDSLDAWFPYKSYRPHQRGMLETCAQCARDGGIAMVDAPTGSGKSSIIAALLSEKKDKKIIVAVRTISQLNTFIRELSLIRSKKPGLKTAYLIGKKSLCPLGGEGDVYRRCEGVKKFSVALMRERAEKGSLVPSKDPLILQQIKRMDPEHPLLCPQFIQSRIFVPGESGSVKMVPSTLLKSKADRVASHGIPPGQLGEISSGVCPYEMMSLAAQKADAVIVNYHHIFDDTIREQLYVSLDVEPGEVILLLDEAHNCGDVMQNIQSVLLEEGAIEQASRELSNLRRDLKGIDAVRHVLPRINEFMHGLKNSDEIEDWFDPTIFDRMIIRGSLYRDMSEIVEELMRISEYIREKNIKAGEYRETAIEHLTEFLFRIAQSSSDPAFLTIYRKEGPEIYLEVRNIDPGRKLQELATSHHSCVMISGTLSPVESYRKYYFEDLPVTPCSLPNAFPAKNRLVFCADDITTSFSTRRDQQTITRITEYIMEFSKIQGNLAVYFPSYQILETYADLLGSRLRKRNLIIEPKDARDAAEALNRFMSLPGRGESGILFAVCGGKWSEGLDYRGDLLSGAFVIGLPLAPFNRVRRMVIDYFRHKFGDEGEFISYTLPAINRATQALGRVLRTPDDRGILVLGDKRFLEKRVKSGLPGWMQDEMIQCDLKIFSGQLKKWKS